jgi:hypothetical protein
MSATRVSATGVLCVFSFSFPFPQSETGDASGVSANTTERKNPIYIAFYCVALVLCRGEDVPPSFGNANEWFRALLWKSMSGGENTQRDCVVRQTSGLRLTPHQHCASSHQGFRSFARVCSPFLHARDPAPSSTRRLCGFSLVARYLFPVFRRFMAETGFTFLLSNQFQYHSPEENLMTFNEPEVTQAARPQGRKAARPQGRKGWHDFCCGALPESTVQRA